MERLTTKTSFNDYAWNGCDWSENDKFKCWNRLGRYEDAHDEIKKIYENCQNGAANDRVSGWNDAITKVLEILKTD